MHRTLYKYISYNKYVGKIKLTQIMYTYRKEREREREKKKKDMYTGRKLATRKWLRLETDRLFNLCWAIPGWTAIPGRPVARAEQAPDISPSSKNQFNIVVTQ